MMILVCLIIGIYAIVLIYKLNTNIVSISKIKKGYIEAEKLIRKLNDESKYIPLEKIEFVNYHEILLKNGDVINTLQLNENYKYGVSQIECGRFLRISETEVINIDTVSTITEKSTFLKIKYEEIIRYSLKEEYYINRAEFLLYGNLKCLYYQTPSIKNIKVEIIKEGLNDK